MSNFTFVSLETNHYFDISIHRGANIISQFDSSYTNSIEISINGNIGYMITSESNENIVIIWTDSINIYTVSGNLSDYELTKIAKNVHPKDTN